MIVESIKQKVNNMIQAGAAQPAGVITDGMRWPLWNTELAF
jgi:hypothetical protein